MDVSVIDAITSVYNRQHFLERLDEEVSRAYRDSHKLAILLVMVILPDEMDRYVRMIRTDDVLYTVAGCIRRSVRKLDVVARYGQMCFGLILPHTAQHADTVAERLYEVVRSIDIESSHRGATFSPSARVGVAKYPTDAINSRDLLRAAAARLGVTLEDLIGEEQYPLKRAA